ncbi:hypothetical protein HK101_005223, partial [Irineochytrium annulatum]
MAISFQDGINRIFYNSSPLDILTNLGLAWLTCVVVALTPVWQGGRLGFLFTAFLSCFVGIFVHRGRVFGFGSAKLSTEPVVRKVYKDKAAPVMTAEGVGFWKRLGAHLGHTLSNTFTMIMANYIVAGGLQLGLLYADNWGAAVVLAGVTLGLQTMITSMAIDSLDTEIQENINFNVFLLFLMPSKVIRLSQSDSIASASFWALTLLSELVTKAFPRVVALALVRRARRKEIVEMLKKVEEEVGVEIEGRDGIAEAIGRMGAVVDEDHAMAKENVEVEDEPPAVAPSVQPVDAAPRPPTLGAPSISPSAAGKGSTLSAPLTPELLMLMLDLPAPPHPATNLRSRSRLLSNGASVGTFGHNNGGASMATFGHGPGG